MSKRISPIVSVALMLPAVASHAASDTDVQTLPTVVVTASRTAQPLKDVIGDVTVISRETLERFSGESVLNALQGQAGVQITSNGGAGKSSSVFLRGAKSGQTLVLIDGIRYSNASFNSYNLQNFPADQIERIEILKGAAASLYGSDAIGGVIQIFTRQGGKAPTASLSIAKGSQGSEEYSAGLSGKLDDTQVSLRVSQQKTDGISAVSNPQSSYFNSDQDGFKNESLSVNLDHKLNQSHRIGLVALATQSENKFDDGSTPAGNDGKDSAIAVWSEHHISPAWLTQLRAGQTLYETDSKSSGHYMQKVVQQQFNLENQLNTSLGKFNLGGEYLNQDIQPKADLKISERRITGIFAGYQHQLDRTHLQINIRQDDNSQFGKEVTYLVGSAFDITEDLQISLSHSTGFKSPAIGELYGAFGANPLLKPESSNNREGSIRYNHDFYKIKLTAYHQDVENLIAYTSKYINVAAIRLQGLTIETNGQYQGYLYGLNYDYTDAEERSTQLYGKQLGRVAKVKGGFFVGYGDQKWGSRLELQASGSRFDDAANLNKLGGYTLMNWSGYVQIQPDLKLSLRVNNLLDERYELAKDYGTLGTNGMLTLTYTPKF